MPIPQPQSGEQQDEFISRCHSAIADDHPDTEERNAVCFRTWRDAKGESDVERAQRDRFPDDQFVKISDIPVWAEHEREDGKVYDRDALKLIVDRNNRRILDTGDFCPATIGHTPTPEELAKGAAQPPVIGFYGNFRLGKIGNQNPRYAIFADEFVRRDRVKDAKDHPRRSVELWTDDDPSEEYFDPIAHLGAETPRLDLGLRFQADRAGKRVWKYAAAAPGPSNTLIPEQFEFSEQDHPRDEGGQFTSGSGKSVSKSVQRALNSFRHVSTPDQAFQAAQDNWFNNADAQKEFKDRKEFAEAVKSAFSSEKFEAKEDVMSENGNDKDRFQEGGNGVPEMTAAAPDPGMVQAVVEAVQQLPEIQFIRQQMAAQTQDAALAPEAFEKDEDAEVEVTVDTDDDSANDVEEFQMTDKERQRYARIERENRELKDRQQKFEKRLAVVEREKVEQYRRSQIREFRAEGYCVDEDEMHEFTKDMTAEQFSKHMAWARKHCEKIEIGATIPIPKSTVNDVVSAQQEQDRSKQFAKRVTDRVAVERVKGNQITYAQAREMVKQEESAAAAAAS